MLQDLGVLRQHEADHHATQQRIALYQDKSGWAQERVSTGYDDVAGLWDIAQRLNEEKANLSKLGLEIASHQHRVAAYAGELWPELLDYLREGEGEKKRNNPVAQLRKPRLPDLSTP